MIASAKCIWKKIFGILSLALMCYCNLHAQHAMVWNKRNDWVDSVYQTMSMNEKIAQLMMVAAFSNRDSNHIRDLECHVKELKVGGLIFFKASSPVRQAAQTNYYQSISKIPLLIGIDGEWGLSMRIDSTPVFPRQMVLGASNDEGLTYKMGRNIGTQLRRMGIHYNFAPDLDVNNNPNNPVINDRSFGENKDVVSRLGAAYAKGMQDENVIACAKHFPGHGDVASDSHFSLPLVAGNRKRLDSLELEPFKELIHKGVMSVMIAHLNVPALDSTPNMPSSLSKAIVTNVLQKEMGFEGLIVTDALNMKGVTDFYGPGEVAAKAMMAGNDILLFVEDVPQAIDRIREYILTGLIDSMQLEKSCKKILASKYWLGLNNYKPIQLDHLTEDLNCCANQQMIRKIVKDGIVVAKNEEQMIPFQNPEYYQIASVAVGSNQFTTFQEYVSHYAKADYFSIDKSEAPAMFDSLFNQLGSYNLIIISLHNTSRFLNKRYGLTSPQIDFINRLLEVKKCILVCNGNPYILSQFPKAKNVIASFEDLELNNQFAAEVLFGAYAADATLPVSVNNELKQGIGVSTKDLERFDYIMPEEKKIDSGPFARIDTIVAEAIDKGAMPGCQILVAKDGKVLYHKAFGFQQYNGAVPVKSYHVYDLASVTKVLATTLAVMHLYENKKIKLEEHLVTYLPWLKGSNKAHLQIQDVMLHHAGLTPFIPFYKNTLIGGKPNPAIYQEEPDSQFCIQVARNLYMHKSYEQYIWNDIMASPVKNPADYVYSDIGFILLWKVVESISGMPIEQYLREHIYKPLNLSFITYNPLLSINPDWIVPTEYDTVFRQQQLWGTVHDQTAAMLGGISGHAGLFANANDVAIIMQMLLNEGSYGGKTVFKQSTVHLFTKKQNKYNRRGLGFDKPETDPKKQSPTSKYASAQTFGHTGFTGTCTWADPKTNLVYVFLSNRVNPTADNKKLVELNVRTRIMDVIYEATKNAR